MTSHKIKLYFSHSVEHLAEKLSDQLKLARQSSPNILKPVEVIVPNGNMQKYLQLDMAKRDGICANVVFPFLETGLFQATQKVTKRNKVQMLNHGDLALKIWRQLSQGDCLQQAVYQPIKHYFSSQDAPALDSQKRWQLAQRLALLLMDYELKRPEMVLRWLAGQLFFNPSQDERLNALEAMQQDLYQGLYEEALDTGDALTLFQLWHQIDWESVPTEQQQGSLHLFTPTRLSAFHRQLLCDLARCYDIHIYQLNVCAEYWQDVETTAEADWRKKVAGQKFQVSNVDGEQIETHPSSVHQSGDALFVELLDEVDDNPLLKAWGKPGREALKLYSDLEEDAIHLDVDFSDEWLESEHKRTASLLHKIQDAILFRQQGEASLTQAEQLRSLQITQAPSKEREVEAVYHNILWHLQQDPELQPSDVAVLVTDMDQYRFVIEQVFAASDKQLGISLPHALVDASVTTESSYARAVLGLFDLFAHDFMRAEVFHWLRNPCVMAALDIGLNDWEDWLKAASQLGIFAGFESLYQTDATNAGTNDEANDDGMSERFTWAQGLKRLHLTLANEAMDHSTLSPERMGQFSALMDDLYQQKLWSKQSRSAASWERFLHRLFDRLLAVPSDLPKEQSVQSALSQSLIKLADQVGDMQLSIDDVRLFIEAELSELSASKGHYLTGGVVCAALQPMRPIPFKITYVLGLDANHFPGGLRHDTLDLSNRSRRIGDINPIENKQYVFLETLMCSRDKLYLSYVGQDLAKAESITRSPVLDELADFAMSFIKPECLPQSQQAFPETILPLESQSHADFRSDASAPADVLVNYQLSDHLLALAKRDHLAAIQLAEQWMQSGKPIKQGIAKQWLNATEAFIEASMHTESNQAKPRKSQLNQVIDIDIKDLSQFLEHAMGEHLARLGMTLKHPDQEALVTHEPFELNGLDKHLLYQQAMSQAIEAKGEKSLLSCLQTAYQAMATKSTLPLSFFVDFEVLAEVAECDTYQNMLKALKPLKACEGPVQIGQAKVERTPVKRLQAIDLALPDGQKVQIHGLVDGLFEKDGVWQAQLLISGSKHSNWNNKMVRPFLNWCLLQLTDPQHVAEDMDLHLFYKNKCHHKTLRFWANDDLTFSSPAVIRQYVTDLVADYLQTDLADLKLADVGNSLKAPSLKNQAQIIKYTGWYKNHPFAYALADISEDDKQAIQEKHEEANSFPEYLEIGNLVDATYLPDALSSMHKRYWPLHAMMLADLPEPDLNGKEGEV